MTIHSYEKQKVLRHVDLVMVASGFSRWEFLNVSEVDVLFGEGNPNVFCNARGHENANITKLLVLHFDFTHPITMTAFVHKSSSLKKQMGDITNEDSKSSSNFQYFTDHF